jgi:hypothetical protein
MRSEPTAAAARATRWLLLACTLFGLAAMHTLGHTAMQMDDHAGHQPTAPIMAVAAAMHVSSENEATTTATADCPGCGQAAGPAAPGHGGMADWSTCLAVITGVAALVLLAALLLARRRPGALPTRSTRTRPRVSRGPPRPTGLTIAAISVLRI